LVPREELSLTPTTTTLCRHHPNPKANQKQNQYSLKPSFSMKIHGCSKKNENELKERKKEKLPHLGTINNH